MVKMTDVAKKDQQMRELLAKKQKRKPSPANKALRDLFSYLCLAVIIIITVVTYPSSWDSVQPQHVWYYGWITAISTGLGVVPFFFFSEPDKFWLAISNSVAGGMMIAASYSLIVEATSLDISEHFGILSQFTKLDLAVHPVVRACCGVLLGCAFIQITKRLLHHYSESHNCDVTDLAGIASIRSAQKMILIVFVMTLHSLTEGIGIGVSFGGQSGMKLGHFISMSLAVHNVPEGLAVGLVLTSRGVSKLNAVLWAVFTSLPQPIFALPAFFFVERCAPMLPGGLGFAAGAMLYVAVFELLSEAVEDTSLLLTGSVGAAACAVMLGLQEAIKFNT